MSYINYFTTCNWDTGERIEVAAIGTPDKNGQVSVRSLTDGSLLERHSDQLTPVGPARDEELMQTLGYPNVGQYSLTPRPGGIFATIEHGPVLVQEHPKDGKIGVAVLSNGDYDTVLVSDLRRLPKTCIDMLYGKVECSELLAPHRKVMIYLQTLREKEMKLRVSTEEWKKSLDGILRWDQKKQRNIFPDLQKGDIISLKGKVMVVEHVRTRAYDQRLHERYITGREVVRTQDGKVAFGETTDEIRAVAVRNGREKQYAHNYGRFCSLRTEEAVKALVEMTAGSNPSNS